MPNLSIKNVPEALVEKLHERAARQHRSMQGELMALLHTALAAPADTTLEMAGRRNGTRRIEEVAAAHRAQHQKALTQGVSATDLIRAERDAR